ncbi:Flap-structured DNA-binding and RNA-binding protein [Basidiobolus ranarum]|uniref:RNA-binding protein VTS1 n=1 Tax=Basidiobolus ranarum TaxID=34480 RepID=A0ABR2WG11_9FUNG
MTAPQQRPLSENISFSRASENSSPDRSSSIASNKAISNQSNNLSATNNGLAGNMEQSTLKSPTLNGKPHGGRPVSEILTTGIPLPAEDAWTKNLSQYEKTLEEMTTTSLDQNFKDELDAVQQWFKALSNSERTASLFSLLQQSSPVQVRFFITVLLQMAKNDPLNGILSKEQISKVEDTLKRTPQVGENNNHSNGTPPIPGISIGAATPTNSGNNRSRRLYDRYSLPAGIPEEVTSFLSSLDSESVNARLATQTILEGRHEGNRNGTSNGNRGSAYLSSNKPQSSYGYKSRPSSQHEADPASVFASNMFFASQNLGATGTGRTVGRSGQRPRSFCGVDALSGTWRSKEITNERPGSAIGDYSAMANSWGMPLSPTLATFAEQVARGIDRPNSRGEDIDVNSLHLNQLRINEANASRKLYDNGLKSPTGNSARRNANPAGLTIAVTEDYPVRDNFPRSANSLAPGSARNRNSYYGEDSLRSPAYMDGNRLQSPLPSPLYPSQHQSRPGSSVSSPIPPGFIPHWAQDSMKRLMSQNPQAAKQYIAMMQGAGSAGLDDGYHGGEKRDHHRNGAHQGDSRNGQPRGNNANKNKGAEVVDLEILKDIPAWLRSLRLHKYTTIFEGMVWQDIIQLSDEELTNKGVAALGARRKMLKVFEAVKKETGL